MYKVFVDANVFFAAVKSETGGAYFILELVKKGLIEVVTVVHALSEAERNIAKKMDDAALSRHYENLLAIKIQVQSLANVPGEVERKFSSIILEKDIPIILGAFLSGAEFLITLDRKHLLDNVKLQILRPPFAILTPGDFIQNYIL